MALELSTRYEPAQIEERIYRFWLEGDWFHTEADWPGESYTIVIPPPNVTGALHMGHALNNTLQDIFIRSRRMQGYNTLWLPGTDHAGIATQNVVEQGLAREDLSRSDLGREAFVERVWRWKEQYGGEIINQLKRLGCSCDWARERFTMDEGLSEAVLETFVRLYEQGLIYRGKYIINWCPRCRTALSDDEVEHEEHEGHLWHIHYPFKDNPKEHVTVATTRPETMLGDTAVAVHPDDERYRDVLGKTVILPVIGREIPVIADDVVDPEFGTGALKVTPAHDPYDFDLSQRHGLEAVVVIDESGVMNRNAGEKYDRMDRFECREALVEELRERGELGRIEPYVHSVGHCYRCRTVVEPYLSDQWFVKMKPLAEKAIRATSEGDVRFHPERWTDFYLTWLREVRDWCISRQIWWGHRLPVYYCEDCEGVTVRQQTPERCAHCGGSKLRQDEDVLDTWFSSALWPFSTLGWPRKTEDLERYYPTSCLVTDRGIIYFWVARMVMMGLEFMEKAPFSDVYIHGTILDEIGRKMSKSLGNGIDPVEMIEKFGADAVRFSLIMLTTEGQDVRLSESTFQMGRHFANKVWNATRFVLMNLEDAPAGESAPADDSPRFEDRWILSRLCAAVESVTDCLEDFRTHEAAQSIYDFFWHEFCDWYLELVKPRLQGREGDGGRVARETLVRVLDDSLRLLHPFAPFLTEELWQKLKEVAYRANLAAAQRMESPALIRAAWPQAEREMKDEQTEADVGFLQELARAIRHTRSEKNIADALRLRVVINSPDGETDEIIEAHADFLREMALLESIRHGAGIAKPPHAAASVVGTTELFVELEGVLDIEEERSRLEKQKAQVSGYLQKVEQKLNNPDFLANAPEQVVSRNTEKRSDLKAQLDKIEQNLADLG